MSPYDVLGVSQSASDDDVAKAYKRLAKQYHPDLNPGNDAAARKMGEINRAYDDIKAMRQQGESYSAASGGYQGRYQSGYQSGYQDPFSQAYRAYTHYRAPRHSPISAILIVIVVFFLVRLLLSVLFGGFGGAYYVNSRGSEPTDSLIVPGYGYYDTVPRN